MTASALPDLGDLDPSEARVLLRIQERASEIIKAHAPEPGTPAQQLSPLLQIKVEALAHLVALTKLHEHGVKHHTAKGNTNQAHLWERDAEMLCGIATALYTIPVT